MLLLDQNGALDDLGARAREMLGVEGRCDPFGIEDLPIAGLQARIAAVQSPELDDARCAEPLLLWSGGRYTELETEVVPLRPARGPLPAVVSLAPVPAVEFQFDAALIAELEADPVSEPAPRDDSAAPDVAGTGAPATESTPNKRATALQGLRILVAEDSPDNQLLISYVILGMGAELVLVENGAEAVSRVRDEHFDVILLDLQMPVLDGFGAARQIAELAPHAPMLAISARADRDVAAECRAAGFDACLEKPLKRAKMLAAVELLLDESRRRPNAPTAPALTVDDEWSALLEDPEFKAMADEFRNDLTRRIDSMREAIRDSDWTLLESLAHQLKGAAGGFGFTELSEASGSLETTLRSGAGDYRAAFERLDELAHAVG